MTMEELIVKSNHLDVLDQILKQIIQRPQHRLQEVVGDVRQYVKSMLLSKPQIGGYQPLAIGGSAFVLRRGNSIFKVRVNSILVFS